MIKPLHPCTKRFIEASSLTEIESRELWEGIKIENPALADLMSNDPFVAELKETFNSTFRFEFSEFNRFIEIGKQQMNNNDNK